MKLNPDCIRDILLDVEDKTDMRHVLRFEFNNRINDTPYNNLSSKYSADELMYHIKQCELSGFFTSCHWYIGGECSVGYLSPLGHEFIENIRMDTNWEQVKKKSKKIGSESLNVIMQIAAQVISSMLTRGH